MISGTISNDAIPINFMKIKVEGPATSFRESPTVSPITAAMCSGVPRDNSNPSMVFLALSNAVPVLLKKGPKSAEQATEPTKTAPNAFIPKAKPIASGTSTLIADALTGRPLPDADGHAYLAAEAKQVRVVPAGG